MSNPAPWRDDDAIALPGQQLTDAELQHLAALANGNGPEAITQMTGASRREQRELESSLRAKLAAFSKAHLITRAFVLGVLSSRALLVLLMLASLAQVTQDTAQRAPRRPRSSISAGRLASASRSKSGPAPADLTLLDLTVV